MTRVPERRPARQRLFFGLWPDSATRRRIAAAGRLFPARSGRPVADSNLHLTLVFMGMLDAAQRDCAMDVAAALALPPFTLSFGQLGCWPRPRVAWLAPVATPAALSDLMVRLRQGLERCCGQAPETRPWQPHITLRRKFRGPVPEARIEPFRWPVTDFCLLESVSGAGGVRYRPLKCWELTAQPHGK